MKKISILLLNFLLISACGGNPSKAAKERDRADEQRKETEQDNADLQEKNERLKTALKNTVSTANGVWTLAAVTTQYQVAVKICDDFEFALPTTTEINEFKSEVYDIKASWQELSFDRFFNKDIPKDQDNAFGFVLCRRNQVIDVLKP